MKKIVLFLALVIAFSGLNVDATTYNSYTYSSKGAAVKSPMPYIAKNQLCGEDFSIGNFVQPNDIYCDHNGYIYICDTGNNRIVVLNKDFTLNKVIDKFIDGYFEGEFSSPNGVFVDKNTNILYIADTGNGRVVGLDEDLVMVKRFDRPNEKEVFSPELQFSPLKVAVDNGGRVFIVAKDVYEGLMQYDSNGNFLGYVGANDVYISPMEYFWKQLLSKKQASKMSYTLPTDFSNLEIDDDGFIYTTTSCISIENTEILVRRQNPSGKDVLRRNENLLSAGDIEYDTESTEYKVGPSNFVDVTVNGNGMYSLLDSKRGRIFTYDFDGNLLYVFGGDSGNGEALGCFYTAVSMIKIGEDFAVLDLSNGLITIFNVTEYGRLINSATANNYIGKYDQAAKEWNEVLKLNANYEQAYVGIGISNLRSEKYDTALKNFKLGNSKTYYSKTFKKIRTEWMRENFIYIAITLIALIVLITIAIARSEKNRFENKRRIINNKFRFAFHTVAHPFDGFYEMRHENKGSLKLSLGIIAVLMLGFVFLGTMTGFVISDKDPADFNIIDEIVKVVGVFLLFCIMNWSVTSLMDGEARFIDIINGTATALIPLALSLVPLTLISNILISEDAVIYYVLFSIIILYTAFLIIVSVMETNQYSFAKTLFVLLITVFGMVIVVFLLMLFVNLLNTMYDFIVKVIREISVR